jgi:hypothetical protein
MIKEFFGSGLDARDAYRIDELAREHGTALEALIAGKVSATSRATAPPTGGVWSAGDFVRNAAPAELGTAASKYVVLGWVCVTSGTPGTWLACRTLTGN